MPAFLQRTSVRFTALGLLAIYLAAEPDRPGHAALFFLIVIMAAIYGVVLLFKRLWGSRPARRRPAQFVVQQRLATPKAVASVNDAYAALPPHAVAVLSGRLQ